MNNHKPIIKRYILTGAPGSGKTSVMKYLNNIMLNSQKSRTEGHDTKWLGGRGNQGRRQGGKGQEARGLETRAQGSDPWYPLPTAFVPEAATDVIAQEQARGNAKPWESPQFFDQITELQKERQEACDQMLFNESGEGEVKIALYDRSPFCTYALGVYLARLLHRDFKPPKGLLGEIKRCQENDIYQKRVFFFENLGFIARTDARQISFEEALVFEQIHKDVYEHFGFERVMVPIGPIPGRCRFVLEALEVSL